MTPRPQLRMSVYMEGSLSKWTNYYLGVCPTNEESMFIVSCFIGWQSRWFVLNDGILTYYLSSNEVSQGCRGSVKVSSCNITGMLLVGVVVVVISSFPFLLQAHPKDQKRIDVIINGESYMYLRASSPSERQTWLIALGSAKQKEVRGNWEIIYYALFNYSMVGSGSNYTSS